MNAEIVKQLSVITEEEQRIAAGTADADRTEERSEADYKEVD